MLSINGSKYCAQHGGTIGVKKEMKSAYRLMRWQDRIKHHAEHDQVKSLRDEVGILRMMMEERLNECQSSTDLLLHSGAIASLVDKIERTVVSCHKLENAMGQLMDKQAILQFADSVVSAVAEIFPNATTEQMTLLGIRISKAQDMGASLEDEQPQAPVDLGGLEDDEAQ
jgi:hypothetical protein